jgi:hypothetical protein
MPHFPASLRFVGLVACGARGIEVYDAALRNP